MFYSWSHRRSCFKKVRQLPHAFVSTDFALFNQKFSQSVNIFLDRVVNVGSSSL